VNQENIKLIVIECRDAEGKLRDLYFDESLNYIKRTIRESFMNGNSEFSVVRNDKNFDFYWLNDFNIY
jgi:hypothetical protein